MTLTKTAEYPFSTRFVARFQDANLPLRASPEAKLVDFLRLAPGWYNGRGKPITKAAFRVARRLLRQATGGVIEATDVFPRRNGGITVAIYFSDRDLAFNIRPGGLIDVDSETDPDFPSLKGLSESHARFIIKGLRQWNSSYSYTFPSTTNVLSGFGAHASKGREMEPVSRFLMGSVPSKPVVPYVLMLGRSIAK
jgi:hypothetical protein